MKFGLGMGSYILCKSISLIFYLKKKVTGMKKFGVRIWHIIFIFCLVSLVSCVFFQKSPTKIRYSDYWSFFPEQTSFLALLPVPIECVEKMHVFDYPAVYQMLAGKLKLSYNIDIISENTIGAKGVDFTKPCGYANIGELATLYFWGINDYSLFKQHLQEQLKHENQQAIEQEIEGNVAFIIKSDVQQALYAYVKNYCLYYSISIKNDTVSSFDLLDSFKKDVLNSTKRLKDYASFQEIQKKLGDPKEIFLYKRDIIPSDIFTIVNDVIASGMNIAFTDDKIVCDHYRIFKENASLFEIYTSTKNVNKVLKKIPQDPILFLYNGLDLENHWNIANNCLDDFFKVLPIGKYFENLDEFFEQMQELFDKQWGVKIQFKEDIFKNISGSSVFALYPTKNPKDISFLCAFKLVDSKKNKMAETLENMYNNFKHSQEYVTKEDSYYVFKKTFYDNMYLALGVVDDYLVCAHKDIFSKMNSSDQSQVLQINEDAISQGFIKVGDLYQKLIVFCSEAMQETLTSGHQFIKEIQLLHFSSKKDKTGSQGSIIIQSQSGNIFKNVFQQIQNMIQRDENKSAK